MLAPGQEMILVVEDEDGVRELIRDLLEMNGFKVLLANNGKEPRLHHDAHRGLIK